MGAYGVRQIRENGVPESTGFGAVFFQKASATISKEGYERYQEYQSLTSLKFLSSITMDIDVETSFDLQYRQAIREWFTVSAEA